MKMEKMDWKIVGSKRVFDAKYLRVRADECVRPDGKKVKEYFVIEGRDWNLCFALTKGGKVVLVRQYKHGVAKVVLELPAGVSEDGESPAQAIKRELREETGYAVTGKIEEFFSFIPEPSQRSNLAHAFFIQGE